MIKRTHPLAKLSVANNIARLGLAVAVVVTCLSLSSGVARAGSYTAIFTRTIIRGTDVRSTS
jgi:hypothetical protein